MFVRRDHAVAALITAAVLLTGCGSPTAPPVSSPVLSSPSPSDDDAAAFEAAEATYRAYVDALNAVDLSDPGTFDPVFALTTGEVRTQAENDLWRMNNQGWRVEGDSVVHSISQAGVRGTSVNLEVCLYVGEVLVRDSSGTVVTMDDRSSIQHLTITVSRGSTGSRVENITTATGGSEC